MNGLMLGCIAVVAASGPISGQDSEHRPLWATANIRVVPNAIHEFSAEICPAGEVVPEIRVLAQPRPWLSVSAGAGRHAEFARGDCFIGVVPPPPDSGTVTRRDHSAVKGYPYYSLNFRVGAERLIAARASVGLFTGVEWLGGKNAIAPVAGLGLNVLLARHTHVLIEAERRQFKIEGADVTTEFRGGAPIEEVREEYDRLEVHGALRVGVRWAVGGRGGLR